MAERWSPPPQRYREPRGPGQVPEARVGSIEFPFPHFIASFGGLAPSVNGNFVALRVSNPLNSGVVVTIEEVFVRSFPTRLWGLFQNKPAADLSTLSPTPSRGEPQEIAKARASRQLDLAVEPGARKLGFFPEGNVNVPLLPEWQLREDAHFSVGMIDGGSLTTDLYDLAIHWREKLR